MDLTNIMPHLPNAQQGTFNWLRISSAPSPTMMVLMLSSPPAPFMIHQTTTTCEKKKAMTTTQQTDFMNNMQAIIETMEQWSLSMEDLITWQDKAMAKATLALTVIIQICHPCHPHMQATSLRSVTIDHMSGLFPFGLSYPPPSLLH